MIYVTGDTHGKFERVSQLCYKGNTSIEDTLIILGDVGINYYLDHRDNYKKEYIKELPITLFCIKGNHEKYAGELDNYRTIEYKGAKAYVEEEYPNIIFAKDGEIYELEVNGCTRNAIVIGGAYSVDKWYRLANNLKWFDDEQPSEETKAYVEEQLDKVNWSIDYVFSHTAPERYEPTEWFLPMIDQEHVDKSTEIWLDDIHSKLVYNQWYCGHYHGSKVIDKIRFMYKDIIRLV